MLKQKIPLLRFAIGSQNALNIWERQQSSPHLPNPICPAELRPVIRAVSGQFIHMSW